MTVKANVLSFNKSFMGIADLLTEWFALWYMVFLVRSQTTINFLTKQLYYMNENSNYISLVDKTTIENNRDT